MKIAIKIKRYLNTIEEHQDLFAYYFQVLTDVNFIDGKSIIVYRNCKKFIQDITIEVNISAIVWVS